MKTKLSKLYKQVKADIAALAADVKRYVRRIKLPGILRLPKTGKLSRPTLKLSARKFRSWAILLTVLTALMLSLLLITLFSRPGDLLYALRLKGEEITHTHSYNRLENRVSEYLWLARENACVPLLLSREKVFDAFKQALAADTEVSIAGIELQADRLRYATTDCPSALPAQTISNAIQLIKLGREVYASAGFGITDTAGRYAELSNLLASDQLAPETKVAVQELLLFVDAQFGDEPGLTIATTDIALTAAENLVAGKEGTIADLYYQTITIACQLYAVAPNCDEAALNSTFASLELEQDQAERGKQILGTYIADYLAIHD